MREAGRKGILHGLGGARIWRLEGKCAPSRRSIVSRGGAGQVGVLLGGFSPSSSGLFRLLRERWADRVG